MDEQLFNEIKTTLEKKRLVYRVENWGLYLKVHTNILMGTTYDYLMVLIMLDDNNQLFIEDNNEIYRILDGYYEVEDKLENLAIKNGFVFDNFNLYRDCKVEELYKAIQDFNKIVKRLIA